MKMFRLLHWMHSSASLWWSRVHFSPFLQNMWLCLDELLEVCKLTLSSSTDSVREHWYEHFRCYYSYLFFFLIWGHHSFVSHVLESKLRSQHAWFLALKPLLETRIAAYRLVRTKKFTRTFNLAEQSQTLKHSAPLHVCSLGRSGTFSRSWLTCVRCLTVSILGRNVCCSKPSYSDLFP